MDSVEKSGMMEIHQVHIDLWVVGETASSL